MARRSARKDRIWADKKRSVPIRSFRADLRAIFPRAIFSAYLRTMFLNVSGIGKKLADKWVLKDINFSQERFRKIAIAGETGSGKSTLLKIIAGLEHPDAGIAFFEGKKIISPLDTLIPGHPGIAYLSQHFELRNNYRVEELLEYANQLSDAEANTLFAVCRIDHLLKRKVDQLSGGEKQRIALARLLVGSPKLLLLDEPFSNMDPVHKDILKSVLHAIGERLQITCILTSHDPLDTLSWADEIIVMKAGKIIQQNIPSAIYYHPSNEYVAGLFGSYNLLSAAQMKMVEGAEHLVSDGKKTFIRPEQLIITASDTSRTIIREENFQGMFTLLEIADGSTTILVKTTGKQFKKGAQVEIRPAQEYQFHQLP
jgi:ABC-type sugar transport system ATPase subunit